MPLDLAGVDLTAEVLRTERLVLRPWSPDDADVLTRAHEDDAMARWLPGPLPYTRDDAAAWIRRSADDRVTGRALLNAMEAGGELVGSAGLHFPLTLLGPMVGYWTAPWARGRGYATEATNALVAWAFARGAHRVHLLADVANLPSQVVARRAGFQEEGRVRGVLPYRGGRYGDAVLWARLPDDLTPG